MRFHVVSFRAGVLTALQSALPFLIAEGAGSAFFENPFSIFVSVRLFVRPEAHRSGIGRYFGSENVTLERSGATPKMTRPGAPLAPLVWLRLALLPCVSRLNIIFSLFGFSEETAF